MISEIISLMICAMLAMVLVYAIYPPLTYDSFTNFIKNTGYPTNQLCKMPLTSPLPQLSGPADATLNSPRTPYHLLGDLNKPL